MKTIEEMRDVEIIRLFKKLEQLDPEDDDYGKVRAQLSGLLNDRDKDIKTKVENENSKKERWIKIGTFGSTLLFAPFIDLLVKRNLTKLIGTVEQMDTFTSTPGRSISSWFRFK